MNSWRLLAALGLGVFFVGLEVERWVLFSGMFFVVWKSAIELWKLQKPSRWLIHFLTLVFLIFVVLRYKTLFSQDSSSSFLLLLTSLKLLEERNHRDQKFLFLLGFVLISSLFLYSLEVPALLAGFGSFFLLWTAQSRDIKYTSFLTKSLPLALFLFLFFPRLQNPFGLQGLTSSQGSTGFSEGLNPGSIAKIQNSKELAFRVQFTNEKKYYTRDQYWRGQVLNFSEGLRWTKTPTPILERIFKKPSHTDYEVTLEPQGKKWLFALEPTEVLQSLHLSFALKKGNFFESIAPIYERVIYQGVLAESAPQGVFEKSDLQIPEVSDKIRELVQSFLVRATTREDLVENILNYYRTQKFAYSKNPGFTSERLEDFLFKGKKGYCEHYAASFATLLRLAQVPAHVVTGYQGGEFNAYGNFWKFTQADAHAWTEYLNEKNQWVRVDPTNAVAPERLELGGGLFEGLPEEWIGQNKTQEYLKFRDSWWLRTREKALQSLESLNYDLVLFLLDFNLERQKELLKEYRYGIIGLGILLLLPFLLQSFFRRRRQHQGKATWLLKELEKKADKWKLHREPSETLRHFIARWVAEKPSQQRALLSLLEAYEAEEYAKGSPPISRHRTRPSLRELNK
ncbi:MAG: transglutaminase family protein [Pseudobdellovibrionaceae bacterium]